MAYKRHADMSPQELEIARAKCREKSKRWRAAHPNAYAENPEYFRKYTYAWRDKNRLKVRAADLERYHKSGRYKAYGITFERFKEMWDAQKGCCAICPKALGSGRTGTHIDHDRKCCPKLPACGKCVRGLLCQKCNIGCGHFDDDPPRLAKGASYLRAYRDRRRAEDSVRESAVA